MEYTPPTSLLAQLPHPPAKLEKPEAPHALPLPGSAVSAERMARIAEEEGSGRAGRHLLAQLADSAAKRSQE